MSTLTRALAKAMLKSLAAYETIYSLVSKSVDPQKQRSVKSLRKWRDALDDKFIELSYDWRAYKDDTNLESDEFNRVTEEGPIIKHNDAWFENIEAEYIDLCEKADDLLDIDSPKSSDKNVSDSKDEILKIRDKKLCDILLAQIEAETDCIEKGSIKLADEVTNISAALDSQKAESLLLRCRNLADRLNNGLQSLILQCLPLMDDSDVREKSEMYNSFVSKHRGILSNISCRIVERTAPKSDATIPSAPVIHKEHRHLKKIDPPKFEGDIIEYPDFKRKWKANVGAANLPFEGELDRLKDNIPVQAAKLIFCENSMDSAWSVLDKMYGNKTMIASKLKNQLKGIKPNGQEDYDIVINLAIDVKAIENRLKELKLENMLRYDDEYLSAVFKALPQTERLEWLKFEKEGFNFEWDALMSFLEKARDKATSSKILLSCCSPASASEFPCSKCGSNTHEKSNCTVRINALDTKQSHDIDDSSDDDADRLRREKDAEVKRRVREQCGKCPLCDRRHTFVRKRDNKEWPSDRFISCADFQRMNPFERASLLERVSGCARCTAWSHTEADCCAPRIKCGLTQNGSVCQADHSRLVCGSGVTYCANLKVSPLNLHSDTSIMPSLDNETLLAFQRVKICGVSESQFACFDNGSNRCLMDNQLRSQKVRYRMKAVGVPEQVKEASIFMFEVEERFQKRTSIWAYGIDRSYHASSK